MILSSNRNLLEDIESAKSEGFTEDFMFRNETLIGRTNKKAYDTSSCVLIEFCRHEGFNDPSDSSILFLIECHDGTKGCLTSAYGKDADTNLIEFVMAINKTKNSF